jgi:hypothetical protein
MVAGSSKESLAVRCGALLSPYRGMEPRHKAIPTGKLYEDLPPGTLLFGDGHRLRVVFADQTLHRVVHVRVDGEPDGRSREREVYLRRDEWQIVPSAERLAEMSRMWSDFRRLCELPNRVPVPTIEDKEIPWA